MSDNKVSVKEALEKLYDLSWMIGSISVEYLTDKDGEKIRDYIGVIEDRINDLEKELSEFKNGRSCGMLELRCGRCFGVMKIKRIIRKQRCWIRERRNNVTYFSYRQCHTWHI